MVSSLDEHRILSGFALKKHNPGQIQERVPRRSFQEAGLGTGARLASEGRAFSMPR